MRLRSSVALGAALVFSGVAICKHILSGNQSTSTVLEGTELPTELLSSMSGERQIPGDRDEVGPASASAFGDVLAVVRKRDGAEAVACKFAENALGTSQRYVCVFAFWKDGLLLYNTDQRRGTGLELWTSLPSVDIQELEANLRNVLQAMPRAPCGFISDERASIITVNGAAPKFVYSSKDPHRREDVALLARQLTELGQSASGCQSMIGCALWDYADALIADAIIRSSAEAGRTVVEYGIEWR